MAIVNASTELQRPFKNRRSWRSAVLCGVDFCGEYFSEDALLEWSQGVIDVLTCPRGHINTDETLQWDGMFLNRGGAQLDNPIPGKTVLFHATRVKDWFSKVQAAGNENVNFRVHVGNLRTAETIMVHSEKGAGCGEVPDGVMKLDEWYLYPLTLRKGAKVNPEYVADDEADLCSMRMGAMRYVNLYEICGDVSMVVNPKDLVQITEPLTIPRYRVQEDRDDYTMLNIDVQGTPKELELTLVA